MGCHIDPPLADVFLDFLESKFVLSSSCVPLFYWQYMDDIFAVSRDKRQADLFLGFLNQWHRKLKVTSKWRRRSCLFLIC